MAKKQRKQNSRTFVSSVMKVETSIRDYMDLGSIVDENVSDIPPDMLDSLVRQALHGRFRDWMQRQPWIKSPELEASCPAYLTLPQASEGHFLYRAARKASISDFQSAFAYHQEVARKHQKSLKRFAVFMKALDASLPKSARAYELAAKYVDLGPADDD